MTQQCAACGHEVGDQAQLCAPCTGLLTRNLADLPELADELHITMTRQDQLGSPASGGRSSETPLAWKVAAGETYRKLRDMLRRWVEQFTRAEPPATDVPVIDLARVLANIVGDVRQHDDGPAFAIACRDAVRECRRVIDKPPERVYLGPCGLEDDDEAVCSEELFARVGADVAVCWACGREHSTHERRALLLGEVQDQNVPATTVAGVLVTHMGVTVTTSMIRGYEARGRLLCKGLDKTGRKLFRVGDVMDVLANRVPDSVGA